jgi:DNA topoisomerase I
MRLRRSVLSGPGIARKRRAKGFAYFSPEGGAVSDPETLQRVKDLVIPPAWKKVWISPYPNAHIQAVGTDAAGRRQYLYHEAWQQSALRRSSTAFWSCPSNCRFGASESRTILPAGG